VRVRSPGGTNSALLDHLERAFLASIKGMGLRSDWAASTSRGAYQAVLSALFQLHLSRQAWSNRAITISGEQVNDLQEAIVNQQDIGAMIKCWVKTGGDRELVLSLVQRFRSPPDLGRLSFGVSLLELASAYPRHCWVIDGLLSGAQGAGRVKGSTAASDPVSRLPSFDAKSLSDCLARFDAHQALAILRQLQGDFGNEIDSILDVAIARKSTSWGGGVQRLECIKALKRDLISALGQP